MMTQQLGLPFLSDDTFSGVVPPPLLPRDPLRGSEIPAQERGDLWSGMVVDIVFSNLSNGFHVLKVRLDSGEGQVSFVGRCEPVAVGDRVEARGRWEEHATHGRQLRAAFVRVRRPSTGVEIVAFLRQGGIRGIGRRTADKLWERFGASLPEVMDRPTVLMTSGIPEKQALLIVEAWKSRSHNTEILAFLYALSVGPVMAERILKEYGSQARQRVLDNPFDLSRDISGIGFRLCDEIALALGFAKDDPRRVEAALRHELLASSREGHTATDRMVLLSRARALLLLSDDVLSRTLDRMILDRSVILETLGDRDLIVEASVFACEKEVARLLSLRARAVSVPVDLSERVSEAARACGLPSLHPHQSRAVEVSLSCALGVITGGPGSGKTSCLSVYLSVLSDLHPGVRVALSAPTGRASQRLSEATQRPASTIHRLLSWDPQKRGFLHDADTPLEADVVVVDEASMLDIWLMRDLLRALPPSARLLLIGDVDQLASVGPGRVLGDIIDSGAFPVSRLTQVFRQAQGSRISHVAQLVNAGQVPNIPLRRDEGDLWGVFDSSPERLAEVLKRVVQDEPRDLGLDPFEDMQILTPGHNGPLGTVAVNRSVQQILNPLSEDSVTVSVGDGLVLSSGDRVLQTVNNYDLDVYNGDIGRVVSVGLTGRVPRVVVRFDDREVVYLGTAQIRELTLAYAISVHKSQGSEFPLVVFLVTTQHFMMLQKPLVYTAITRARRRCVVVGQKKALAMSVKRAGDARHTLLSRRLVSETSQRAWSSS